MKRKTTAAQRVADRKIQIVKAEHDIIDHIAAERFGPDLQGVYAAMDGKYDHLDVFEALYSLERDGRIKTDKTTARSFYRLGI